MNTANLLLTLGHGSSAILVHTSGGIGNITCGYEEERLSLIKSDSQFPKNAIARCLEYAGIEEVDNIFVTHWNPMNDLDQMSHKHWRPDLLPKHRNLHTHGRTAKGDGHQTYTHHDAHAHAALWYAYGGAPFGYPQLSPEGTMIFVVDGFGNYGEHISIYKIRDGRPVIVRRFFGYGGSLGLMYQYMTAFLGMKQHEDEYKLLGYETLIHEMDIDLKMLHELIDTEVSRYIDGYFDMRSSTGEFDPMLRLDALPALQKDLIDRWTKICNKIGVQPGSNHDTRIVMAYYCQAVLEGVMKMLIRIYRPTNIIAAGGVFYNVKLNRILLDLIPGKLCVFPIAGDQGNAIGLFEAIHGNLTWPGHFYWGHRAKAENPRELGLHFVGSTETAQGIAAEAIQLRGMVNVVRGAMEFGPRALCHTSTIALPVPGVVNRINNMNSRNTVMPMAPVMPRSEYKARMLLTHKVHMSEEHMIVALPYKPFGHTDILGAAHEYQAEYTGRPQVLDNDSFMSFLFSAWPVLINTSFNVHGVPIVYSMKDVVHSHKKQREVAPIITIYLENQ